MALKASILFFLCIFVNVESANILGLFHLPSFSHNIVGKTLSKALAERGHHVTMLSPFPLKTPMKNYEDIYLEEVVKFKEKGVMEMIMAAENASVYTQLATMQEIMVQMAELCLNDSQTTTLLASKKTFDLVMMDWALNDALLGIADYYKAPVVVVSPVGSSPMTNKITANPAPFAYVPNLISSSSDEMGFFMRLANTFSSIAYRIYENVSQEPSQDTLLHKYFPSAPPLSELIKNVSLVFLNSHFSIETPRPYVPNMVPIGGLHMQEPQKLPPELKKFLDEAKEGVLYFSLGNNAKSSDLPADKINSIVTTFKNLPVKVLWKFEGNNVPEVSANVRIGKWFPQSDLLAHPNVKLFVTHGGLLSTIESIYRGVPMVGIPCFSDQEPNVENNVRKGFSEMVHLNDLNEESLTSAIKKVLSNPRYRENVRKQSALLKDQPLKPLNNAVFWVEYVLRHKGAPHLKTGALKLEWYQYYLLDITGFVFSITAVILFLLYKVLTILKQKMCDKKISSQDPLLKKRKKE